MERRTLSWLGCIGLALLPLLTQPSATAGGISMTVQPPASKTIAGPKDTVLIARVEGCFKPEAASVSATADGVVDGKRRSIALQPVRTAPGVFAIRRQWPDHGVWVLAVTGQAEGFIRSDLIDLQALSMPGVAGRQADGWKRSIIREAYGPMKWSEQVTALQALVQASSAKSGASREANRG
jgi:hypothetical protein